jgi:hypothetical protein
MKFIATAAAAVLIGLSPLAASAAISIGTQLTGSIDQSLSSNHATVGEPFTLSGVRSSDNNITGAKVYGHRRPKSGSGHAWEDLACVRSSRNA